VLEVAHDPYLRPNGLGGYRISVSAIAAFSRCGLAKFYEDRARKDPEAPQPRRMSATVYGSVLHHVFMLLEQWHHAGEDHIQERALAAFEHYWNAENLHEIGLERVNEWLRGQTWASLKEKGRAAIRDHYSVLQNDPSWLLALEYEFAVPLPVAGRVHTLYGFVDRLSIRKHNTKPYISIEDFKSGKKKSYLRQEMQFTGYAYASSLLEFWRGWDDYEDIANLEVFDAETMDRIERSFHSYGYALTQQQADATGMDLAGRRGWWVNLKDYGKHDCGWRTQRDYAKLALGVDGYVRAREAGAYPITNSGEECQFCPFRTTCGGVGLPPDGSGAP
jgi:RecB family exonuclease